MQKVLKTKRNFHEASLVQQRVAPEVHQSSNGEKSSIIEILEVIESLFSPKMWWHFHVQRTTSPKRGQHEITQDIKVNNVCKKQNVKYKDHESTNLKRSAGDWDSSNAELSAVVQFLRDTLGFVEGFKKDTTFTLDGGVQERRPRLLW